MSESETIKQELQTIKAYCLLSAKNVLTIDDVAVLTGLSKLHLYKLTANRAIPYYRPNGKNIYFDRGEIEDWLKQNKVKTFDELRTQSAVNSLMG